MAQAQKESQLYAGKLQSDQSQINATMKLIEQIKKQAEAARVINTTVNKSQSNVSIKDSKVSSSTSTSSTSRKSNTSSSRPSRGTSVNSNYSGNAVVAYASNFQGRSEEHTSELQSRQYLVCRLLLEKKKTLAKY